MLFALTFLTKSHRISRSRAEREGSASSSFFQSFVFRPYQAQTKGEKRVLLALLVVSGIVLLILVIYYILNPRQIVGDQLVNNANGTPAEVPSPGISPIYVKPVTILFAAGVVFSYCFFALTRNLIAKYFPRPLRSLLLVFSVLLLALGIYEVFFNFVLWGALMVSGASPNALVNSHPNPSIGTNLAYATKATVLWCIVAFFAVVTFKNTLD